MCVYARVYLSTVALRLVLGYLCIIQETSFTKNNYIIIFDETVNIMYSSKNYVEFTRNKEGCGLLKPDLEMS